MYAEEHEDAHKEEAAVNERADFEAETWSRRGIYDWYATFSFDGKTHERNRLKTPERLHKFVEQQIRRFGYRGPFVIVAHDNQNSHYYHAHCLLADYKLGICKDLTDKFRRFGNVSNADDGPIRGMGAFYYCANRAYPYPNSIDLAHVCDKWVRRPRKRGRGRGRGTRDTGQGTSTAKEVA
jgi:hypothetical protein